MARKKAATIGSGADAAALGRLTHVAAEPELHRRVSALMQQLASPRGAGRAAGDISAMVLDPTFAAAFAEAGGLARLVDQLRGSSASLASKATTAATIHNLLLKLPAAHCAEAVSALISQRAGPLLVQLEVKAKLANKQRGEFAAVLLCLLEKASSPPSATQAAEVLTPAAITQLASLLAGLPSQGSLQSLYARLLMLASCCASELVGDEPSAISALVFALEQAFPKAQALAAAALMALVGEGFGSVVEAAGPAVLADVIDHGAAGGYRYIPDYKPFIERAPSLVRPSTLVPIAEACVDALASTKPKSRDFAAELLWSFVVRPEGKALGSALVSAGAMGSLAYYLQDAKQTAADSSLIDDPCTMGLLALLTTTPGSAAAFVAAGGVAGAVVLLQGTAAPNCGLLILLVLSACSEDLPEIGREVRKLCVWPDRLTPPGEESRSGEKTCDNGRTSHVPEGSSSDSTDPGSSDRTSPPESRPSLGKRGSSSSQSPPQRGEAATADQGSSSSSSSQPSPLEKSQGRADEPSPSPTSGSEDLGSSSRQSSPIEESSSGSAKEAGTSNGEGGERADPGQDPSQQGRAICAAGGIAAVTRWLTSHQDSAPENRICDALRILMHCSEDAECVADVAAAGCIGPAIGAAWLDERLAEPVLCMLDAFATAQAIPAGLTWQNSTVAFCVRQLWSCDQGLRLAAISTLLRFRDVAMVSGDGVKPEKFFEALEAAGGVGAMLFALMHHGGEDGALQCAAEAVDSEAEEGLPVTDLAKFAVELLLQAVEGEGSAWARGDVVRLFGAYGWARLRPLVRTSMYPRFRKVQRVVDLQEAYVGYQSSDRTSLAGIRARLDRERERVLHCEKVCRDLVEGRWHLGDSGVEPQLAALLESLPRVSSRYQDAAAKTLRDVTAVYPDLVEAVAAQEGWARQLMRVASSLNSNPARRYALGALRNMSAGNNANRASICSNGGVERPLWFLQNCRIMGKDLSAFLALLRALARGGPFYQRLIRRAGGVAPFLIQLDASRIDHLTSSEADQLRAEMAATLRVLARDPALAQQALQRLPADFSRRVGVTYGQVLLARCFA